MTTASDISRLLDECPRCGYGPLNLYRKESRARCPACHLRFRPPISKPVG